MTTNASAAHNPAAGAIAMARAVTRTGPTTNTASSISDSIANPVSIRGSPASRAVHRARAYAPICGWEAPTAAPAVTRSHPAAPACPATIRAVNATACTASCGRSTRL